jgi:hypothetical protein
MIEKEVRFASNESASRDDFLALIDKAEGYPRQPTHVGKHCLDLPDAIKISHRHTIYRTITRTGEYAVDVDPVIDALRTRDVSATLSTDETTRLRSAITRATTREPDEAPQAGSGGR